MIAKGYVALFAEPHTKESAVAFVESWLERFEKVEQVIPEIKLGNATLQVQNAAEIMWTEQLQFRVINGGEFTWVYFTLGRRAIETTGLPSDEISLCLDVLTELPGTTEIIEGHNDKRLDECEAQGLL
jgi:hypothetical protein